MAVPASAAEGMLSEYPRNSAKFPLDTKCPFQGIHGHMNVHSAYTKGGRRRGTLPTNCKALALSVDEGATSACFLQRECRRPERRSVPLDLQAVHILHIEVDACGLEDRLVFGL